MVIKHYNCKIKKGKENKMQDIRQNKEKSYAGITKFMLIMRIIVAVYLIYLSCTLIQAYLNGDGLPLYVLIIALTVFFGFAVAATVFSVKSLIKGEYSGGKADKSNKDNGEIHESKETSDEQEQDKSNNNALLSDRLKKYNEQEDNKDRDDIDYD